MKTTLTINDITYQLSTFQPVYGMFNLINSDRYFQVYAKDDQLYIVNVAYNKHYKAVVA